RSWCRCSWYRSGWYRCGWSGDRVGSVRALDVQRRLLHRVLVALDVREDVGLAHAAVTTGSGDLGEIDVVLGGDPLDDGGVVATVEAVGSVVPRRHTWSGLRLLRRSR